MKYLLLSIFCFITVLSAAQQRFHSVTKYDMEDGLSHNQVGWIFKDQRGMIWVGASDGINRFDGTSFKFVAEVDFYRVWDQKIFEDYEGDLWLKVNDAEEPLVFFNTRTESLKNFEEKFGKNAPFTKDEFYHGTRMSDRSILIGTNTGRLIRFYNNQRFEEITIDYDKYIIPYAASNNTYWVCGTAEKISHRTGKNTRAELYYFNRNNQLQQHLTVDNLYNIAGLTSKEHLLYVNREDVHEVDTNGAIKSTELSNCINQQDFNFSSTSRLSYDKHQNRFWYSTYGHVLSFEYGGKKECYKSKKSDGLITNSYFQFLKDGEYYWLGTIDGLFKIQITPDRFKKMNYLNPKDHEQFQYISCRGISSDKKGNLYASTHRTTIFNKENEIITGQTLEEIAATYRKDLYGNWVLDLHQDQSPYYIKNVNRCYATYCDEEDNLWLSDFYNIFKVDLETKDQKKYGFPPKGKASFSTSLFKTKDKRLWIGNHHGLYYLEDGAKQIQKFDQSVSPIQDSIGKVYSMYLDDQERFWLASTTGLFLYDEEKGITERYWTKGIGKFKFPTNDLRHINQDKEGIFWIGTNDGLIRWNENKDELKFLTKKDGLSNNRIHAAYDDGFGFMWLSSENGIMQLEKSTLKLKTYFPSDGITHREFNRTAHHQKPDGTLYFGGINGITCFHPKDFKDDFHEILDIPLVLTECELYSGKTDKQEDQMSQYLNNGKIVMAPNDRYLKLQFALLDYTNTKSIRYAYTIDEAQGWNEGRENAINIGTLPYGDHILTVKGITANGIPSKNTLQIPITVLRPFYMQWWFIALGLISIIASVFLVQKAKTKRLLQRQKELEETVAERTQTISAQAEELQEMDKAKSHFLANISHEFKTPLTLILNTLEEEHQDKIMQAVSKMQVPNSATVFDQRTLSKKELDILRRNTYRLQTLIDQILDLSKLENKQLELQAAPADFENYLKELISSFEDLAKNKNIAIRFIPPIEIDPGNEGNIELYFDQEKMDKIIYNLLGNAIKFTPENGNIEITLHRNNNALALKVKDSGIGIPKEDLPQIFDRFYRVKRADQYAYEGTGIGLALVKELTLLHHGQIAVESVIDQGTCFTLSFPLGKAHLRPEELAVDIPLGFRQKIGMQTIEQNYDPIALETISNDSEKPILLIIEDNEDLRYHQQKSFADSYQVLLAKDGVEGVEKALEVIPDLIVCDIMMPNKNGYEVCAELKADERTSHIPIILLTAKAAQEEKIEGLSVGADDYLTKPYHQAELKLRLNNQLRHIKNIQAQFSLTQTTQSSALKTTQTQNPFIKKIYEIIEVNYKDPNFSVEELSAAVHLSRSHLYRKIKALTGETANNLIRTFRLQEAKKLLESMEVNASEVAYMVGFNSPSYFYKCFKAEYNITAGEYANAPK